MNWTGGSLQRHSKRASKDIVNRQKAHFARVRTTLQNGPNPQPAPFVPSYFQDEDVGPGGRLPTFGIGSVRHAGHSKRLQERRDKETPPSLEQIHDGGPTESGWAFEMAASRRRRAGSYQRVIDHASASPGRRARGGTPCTYPSIPLPGHVLLTA